jgi:hypothetical protein
VANFAFRGPLGIVDDTDDGLGVRDDGAANPFGPPRGGLQEGCAAMFYRSAELTEERFKHAVMQEQVDRRVRRGSTPVYELVKEDRLPIEGSYEMHKDVAPHFLKMYTALKAALAAEKTARIAAALRVKMVGVASAYRHSNHDRKLWNSYYPGYLKSTEPARKRAPGGPARRPAVEAFVNFMDGRKAPPGFSNHTRGIAVDFQTQEDGQPLCTTDTSPPSRARWLTTWLHHWLAAHAHEHKFYQLKTEEFHWEYQPVRIPPTLVKRP